MMSSTVRNHQGVRVGITKDGERYTANELAALREKGIEIQVYCAICGEPLTLVRYPGCENEYYFRCDDEHRYEYCRQLAHMASSSIRDEKDLSWILNTDLTATKKRVKKVNGPNGPEPPEGSEGSDDLSEGDGDSEIDEIDTPNEPVDFLSPEGEDDLQNGSEIPKVPETASPNSLKQFYYSDDYYAPNPMRLLPPSNVPIGEHIMLLQTNEQMIRALCGLPSALTAFSGGRFVVEGKVARYQRFLDKRCLDFQSTARINGRPVTVYIPCLFKKAADMERVLRKAATREYAENGVDQVFTPTATVLIWGDFEVSEYKGTIRLKATILNSKQTYVTLPFDECPDRSCKI